MKAIGVPLALVLLVLFYLSFSVYSHHQNLLLSVYNLLVRPNSKLGRFAFFVVFVFIIVIISLGSTKTSEADFEGFFSQTSLLYESIYNVDDNEHQGYDGSDEDINSDDIGGEEDDDENGTDNEHQGYDGSDEDINSDDIGGEEDDDENGTDNEHQGYDGSDEDNKEDINSDVIGSEDDDDDDDEENDTGNEIEKRAEEFIAEVKQKWREELLTDRFLCITSA